MALRKPVTTYVLTSQTAASAATGSSGPIVLRDFDFNSLVFELSVLSTSSTVGLNVTIQTSMDYGTTWFDTLKFPTVNASSANPSWGVSSVGALAMIGTVGSSTITSTAGGTGVPLLSNVLQVIWNMTGSTPTATFTVNALETSQDGRVG